MNCHETIIFNNIKFYVHPILIDMPLAKMDRYLAKNIK